jgi:2-C-methyl-D-erythritol 2,4-cyclodiphosphate synthase
MFRVGIGQDSHRFSKDKSKKLFLGGLRIDSETGFDSNSDGDVILHALCNALESAIGNNSFSVYADEMCQRGITDSKEYLKVTLSSITKKGYSINNISVSLECKKPKILPLVSKIKNELAKSTKISEDAIGIVATSGEKLTPFGKGEGVQAIVIVSLTKNT